MNSRAIASARRIIDSVSAMKTTALLFDHRRERLEGRVVVWPR